MSRFRYITRRVAAGVTALVLATGFVDAGHLAADVAFHNASDQEKSIEQLLATATGDSRILRCVAPEHMPLAELKVDVDGASDVAAGMAGYGVPVIWLSTDSCNRISEYLRHPIVKKTNPGEGIPSLLGVSGLEILAHEDRHTRGTMNEAGADCEALQLVGDLAIAAGTPPDLRDEVTFWTGVWLQDTQAPPYMLDGVCVPGSDYDLHQRYAFPWPPERPKTLLSVGA